MKKSWTDRFMGEKYRYLNLEEKNKKLVKLYFMQQVLSICLMILLALMIYLTLSTFYPIPTKVKIVYDNLTKEEIIHVENIMSNIKPEYLATQKSITFTHNLSKFYKPIYLSSEKALKESETFAGYNHNKNIYIAYNKDDILLRKTIFHELLHSFFTVSEESHKIIYDLENYLSCYNDTQTSIKLNSQYENGSNN